MATARKKTPAKKPVKKTRLLTQVERKNLKNRFQSYLKLIDTLAEKNISAQTKSDLKKFRASLKKSSPILTKF